MKEKINLIIDRSLANSLDNNLEDIMDWNKLEKNLEGLEFEVAPDQSSFYLNRRPVSTKLGWIGSEDNVGNFFNKNRSDIQKNIGESKKVTYHIRSFRRSYPRIGDSTLSKEMCPVVVEYAVNID